eukprot:scaffold122646_cov30-Tisochrysis_lutea.AAC.4
MQRSVLQLLDIMTDELRLQGAPEPAVVPLIALRKKSAALDPAWFNLVSSFLSQRASRLRS